MHGLAGEGTQNVWAYPSEREDAVKRRLIVRGDRVKERGRRESLAKGDKSTIHRLLIINGRFLIKLTFFRY